MLKQAYNKAKQINQMQVKAMHTLEDVKKLIKQTQNQQKSCMFYLDDYEIELAFQQKQVYVRIFLYKNLNLMELDKLAQQLIQKNSQILGQSAFALAIISASPSIVLRACLNASMHTVLSALEVGLNHADFLLSRTYALNTQ